MSTGRRWPRSSPPGRSDGTAVCGDFGISRPYGDPALTAVGTVVDDPRLPPGQLAKKPVPRISAETRG